MARNLVVFLVVMIVAMCFAGTPVAAQQPPATDDCSFPLSRVDGGGTTVTIAEEPDRVVTLNPSAAQTMWEIGARDKVVGLTKYASYLDGASALPTVSSETNIVVFERVVNLTPDLVLAPNTISNDTVRTLRDAGITVYHFPPEYELADVYSKVQRIGELTGECDGAEQTVAWMKQEIDIVERAVQNQPRPDALYLFYGYTAGNSTFIHDIIETAGANNLAADVGISWYQQISHEVVLDQNPEWIILNSNDPAVPREEAFNATTAVQENQTVVIPIEHLNQPAPRAVYAVTNLTKAFHPEAYAAAKNATDTPTPPQTPQPTPTESREMTPTESPGQPGFGLLLPLLGLSVLVSRALITRPDQ